MVTYARGNVERIAIEALTGGQMDEMLEDITSRLFGGVDTDPSGLGTGVRNDSTLSQSDGANGTGDPLESKLPHLRDAISTWVSAKLVPYVLTCAMEYAITHLTDSFTDNQRQSPDRTKPAIKGPGARRSEQPASSTLQEFLQSLAGEQREERREQAAPGFDPWTSTRVVERPKPEEDESTPPGRVAESEVNRAVPIDGIYEGTVKLDVRADKASSRQVLRFVSDLHQQTDFRMLRLDTKDSQAVEVLVGLRAPVNMKDALLDMGAVSRVDTWSSPHSGANEQVIRVELSPVH